MENLKQEQAAEEKSLDEGALGENSDEQADEREHPDGGRLN